MKSQFSQWDAALIGLVGIILLPITLAWLFGALLIKVGEYLARRADELNKEYGETK